MNGRPSPKQTRDRNGNLALFAPSRGGFTLLEAILSISLTMLLMVGLITGTSLYAQYHARGLTGIAHTKVLLGTIEDLRQDLRACYPDASFAWQDIRSLNARAPATGSRLQSEKSIGQRVLLLDASEGEQLVHFIGRPNAIFFRRHGTSLRFDDLAPQRVSTIQCVAWLAPSIREIRTPQTYSASSITQETFRVPSGTPGLQRGIRHFPIFGESALAELAFSQDVKQPYWQSNESIHSASFRYFGSKQWQPEWDSHLQNGKLPAAVEVTISLVSDPNRSYRVVIQLPGDDQP